MGSKYKARQSHKQIHTDKGSNFEAELFSELCKMLGIKNTVELQVSVQPRAREQICWKDGTDHYNAALTP